MAGLIDDTVDDLDDLGDSADGAGDDLSDAVDDAINHSKQLFDYVEIRLNYLDRITNKWASRFNDWMDSLEKHENLDKQIAATIDQAFGNSYGATTYARKATESAYDYTYYETIKDADGKNSHEEERHISLANEINLDDLISGKYSIEEIDTSDAHGQALYDAAQEFMNFNGKAESAADQVQ